MKRTLRWLPVLFAFVAAPAMAQSPTAENTVITNTASVSYTDANGNTYAPVNASVSVTVGFQAGVDVTVAATASPASPSAGNELAFTLTNIGNGTDQLRISAFSAGAGLTITGFKLGATTHADTAALNAALAATNVTAGGSAVVTVVYTVAAGRGGLSSALGLTASSVRTPATNDAASSTVTPPIAGTVTVTRAVASVNRLPSNGAPAYSMTFDVTNGANASRTFNISAVSSAAAVTIVSVNGGSATSTINASSSTTITVTYTVGDVAAGSTADVTLTATAADDAAVTDSDATTVTVVRASLSMTKEAFRDNQTTAIGASDRVLPGEYIQYRITVTNGGGADAASVSVSDALPAAVTHVSSTGDLAGWTFGLAGTTVSADLTGGLAAGASRFFWVRVQVK
jgi:uncharacterized repeat protein (TIGR01451 family)